LLENFRTKTTLPTKQGQFEVWFKLPRKYSFKKINLKWYLNFKKNPELGIWRGRDGQGEASQRRVVHNWGKKRVEKQLPPCLYYLTKTPSIIFGLKIIMPSYTQRDEN
jgi:hypothetical protein